ncbi:MAG: hypothetical protein MZV70_56270 [Desulfobacterales bacterium]|nr:hypothetical protein [Desulfobacterales bacterium]
MTFSISAGQDLLLHLLRPDRRGHRRLPPLVFRDKPSARIRLCAEASALEHFQQHPAAGGRQGALAGGDQRRRAGGS